MTAEDISSLIAGINAGEVSDVQIAGFQVALLMKGATQEEHAHFATQMPTAFAGRRSEQFFQPRKSLVKQRDEVVGEHGFFIFSS